jgi:uncharacterized iron-regulated protein
MARCLVFFILVGTVGSIFWGGSSAFGQQIYDARQLSPHSAKPRSMDDLADSLPKGSIVVVGENHNYKAIQNGQMQLLSALRQRGHRVSVAMEFLVYPIQDSVEAYRNGELSEEDFKAKAWGEADFQFYRDQILFPRRDEGGRTLAINIPKQIPLAVKERGLAQLTEEERKFLPPDVTLGRASYRERFVERMIGHVSSEESMNRYFETQSLWDDTMAWKVCSSRRGDDETLVIIVGQFHVEYGDGFIDRLRARCPQKETVTSIYQYLYYSDEIVDLVSFYPSAKYGPIADYLMLVQQD